MKRIGRGVQRDGIRRLEVFRGEDVSEEETDEPVRSYNQPQR